MTTLSSWNQDIHWNPFKQTDTDNLNYTVFFSQKLISPHHSCPQSLKNMSSFNILLYGKMLTTKYILLYEYFNTITFIFS